MRCPRIRCPNTPLASAYTPPRRMRRFAGYSNPKPRSRKLT